MKPDKNKELILACGSKTGAYDIDAPDQWRWIMLYAKDPLERGIAWVRSKTLAFRHESPFCVDEHGRPVYARHLAAEMGWEDQTARNVLCKLESQKRVRLEKGKRIWYCADVPKANEKQTPAPTAATEDSADEPDDDGRTEGESNNSVQSYCPTYLTDFIEKLPTEKRSIATAKWEANLTWRREFFRNGMEQLRVIADRVEDTTLLEIGLPKKRLPKRPKPEAAAKTKWVQVKLFEEPNFVQSCDLTPYKVQTDSVDARAFRTAATAATTSSDPGDLSLPSGVSSSSISKEAKKTPPAPSLRDDDEKPKPEYATPKDELKAIYFAKTGEYPAVSVLDRVEGILATKGKTWGNYLEILKPHLGGKWERPAGFLTWLARTGFEAESSPPQLKPKPKCPTCFADNQRGAVLLNGAIVACPACSTAEWRKEMEVKLTRPALKTRGAAND